ncbi:MAG: PAS domain S-box protein [Deltaproteobacteria bacterium]|nr:PAS domain S-box protein [Deltaproteobacteria bacterium]
MLFQQAFMLGGIVLGHSLEERLGLRPQVVGATTLLDSLALLVQFNVAGRLTHHAFGPRVAAWERGLDAQTEALARENLGILRPRRGGFPFGPLPALAAAGPAVPELGRRPVEDLLRGLQVHMSKMDEGGMGGRGPEHSAADRAGAVSGVDPNRLDRDISTLLLTAGDNFEAGLRTFIDSQPIATAVARLERNNNDFGRIFMANRKFTELFGFTEAEAGQHNITYFFNKLSLPFIASRIWGIFRGGIFTPSNMKFRHRDGSWVEIVGSGVIKDVAGHSIAFGFYEPRGEAGRGERSQKQLLDALSSSNREAPLRSHEGGFEMESVSELSAQLTRSGSPLLQRALEQDLLVRITNMPWVHAPESYNDPLLRYFNLQARKLDFPIGRRVVVEFSATDSRARTTITMVKFSEGFRALGLAEANAPAAEPPTGVRGTTAPLTAVSESVPEGPTPTAARFAAGLERLQSQLGAALNRAKERVAREDVTLTLSGPFDAAFLSQNLESLTGELQALTQNRIPIPLGRLVTLEIPTERGTVRLVFKKVLLNFERLE